MGTVQIDPTSSLYYEDDYFGEPWREPETVLLVHGVAESSLAWYAWVPHLARSYRVLRPDLRGFGRSSIPQPHYSFSIDGFVRDLVLFLDELHIDSAHVVAAKLGGTIAMQLAADHPERIRTLSILSSPVRAHNPGASSPLERFAGDVRTHGVRGWVEDSQRARLGSDVSAAQFAWWTDFMASVDPRVCAEVTALAGRLDITGALPRITAPTLVVTTEASALQSVETVRSWQSRIPSAELLVMPGDSYHVAAVRPDECAAHVLAFIDRHAQHPR